MGKRTSYPPGMFSWAELGTEEPDEAAAFYETVFGWKVEEAPAAGATNFMLDGDAVAGLRSPLEPASDHPTGWLCYVTVESAEEQAARAGALGGVVLQRALEDDWGRRALIQDPAGAILGVWQPGTHIGAARVNDPGCLSWNDLVTADPLDAERFYSELFGWEIEELRDAGGYRLIKSAGSINGGVMPAELVGNPPSQWLPYFNAGNLDTTVATIKRAGGRLLAGPQQVPAGRFALAADAQGVGFALFEGEVDD